MADFSYHLPPELIAQFPASVRDESRLLVLHRGSGRIEHRVFRDLPAYLKPGDALVLNDTRVIPARLHAVKENGGGRVELLLVEPLGVNDWRVMVRPGKRLRPGTRLNLVPTGGGDPVGSALVVEKDLEGLCRLRFLGASDLLGELDRLGETPLPPYIARRADTGAIDDRARYQTVYAQWAGAVAAPTAGLHFTAALLDRVQQLGVEVVCLTLHVGPGTFLPVKTARVEDHRLQEEQFEFSEASAVRLGRVRKSGGRIFAVGTTTVRVLEHVLGQTGGSFVAASGKTGLFIYPPWRFQAVDALITNFHLPRSTLLMLVSAFASPGADRGRELVLQTYAAAVKERYRFYSYGDAMLVL